MIEKTKPYELGLVQEDFSRIAQPRSLDTSTVVVDRTYTLLLNRIAAVWAKHGELTLNDVNNDIQLLGGLSR